MFTTTNKSPLGTLNDRNHRGVFNALAGAALACMAIASSHVNAAVLITFTENADQTAINVEVEGTLNVNGAPASDPIQWEFSSPPVVLPSTQGGLLVDGGQILGKPYQLVGSFGTSTDEAVYYALAVPEQNTWTSAANTGGAHSETEFLLNALSDGDAVIGFNNNAPPSEGVYTLSATITLATDNFGDIGATAGSEFVYTLLGSDSNPLTGADRTVTVRFVTSQLAPVPLPASVLLLGAGIGGFGLMGRLRRRKLNA